MIIQLPFNKKLTQQRHHEILRTNKAEQPSSQTSSFKQPCENMYYFLE